MSKKKNIGFRVELSIPQEEWDKFTPERRTAVYTAMASMLLYSCRTKTLARKMVREVERQIEKCRSVQS